MSAFLLFEGGWWEQPTFFLRSPATEQEIEQAIRWEFRSSDLVFIAGIAEDPDAPEDGEYTVLTPEAVVK